MRSQIPDGFLQSLTTNGFSDLGLTPIRESELFRPIALSRLHLENKLELRRRQLASALGEAEFKGKEKVYAYDLGSIENQQALISFIQRKQPSLVEGLQVANNNELLWQTSLRVCDDLCLLRETTKGYRLIAGSLCAPSAWSLASMLGKSVAQLHAPVPSLNHERASSIDRLLSHLSITKSFQRFNWGLKTTDCLALFPGTKPFMPKSFDDIYLRIERQTLTRISRFSVVFGIDVTVGKLTNVCAQEPSLRKLLINAYRKLSDQQLKYKGIVDFGKFL